MAEACPNCGVVHEGDCPEPATAPSPPAGAAEGTVQATAVESATPAGAAGVAAQAATVEACPFCGELHPPSVKCGEWAKQRSSDSPAPWSSAALSSLPPLPRVTIQPRPEKPPKRSIQPIVTRVAVFALAAFGAATLLWLVVSRVSGGSGTTAAIPACTNDRIRQNLARAVTVQSEGSTSLYRRIDQNNALLLSSSTDCDQRAFVLFTTYINAQSLCLSLPTSGACQARDTARAQLSAEIGSP